MPGKQNGYDVYSDTMLPEGIEAVHPRYAISLRNRWMLQKADYVICRIDHGWGSAARWIETAVHMGKTGICLGEGDTGMPVIPEKKIF